MITLSIVGELHRFGGKYYLHLQDISGLSGQVAAQLTASIIRTLLQRRQIGKMGYKERICIVVSPVVPRTCKKSVKCDPADT
jgi:hypothetical protein